jgi:hypothetical protein
MKKVLLVFLSALLCLSLAACGSGSSAQAEPAPFDPEADAQTLLDSGAFSESLTPIDQSVACALYGIDESTVTSSAAYGSLGTTAEELAIFTLTDEAAAQTALKDLQYRVEDRTEELKSYLPDEVSKLDQAVLEQRGTSVLLVVAADYGPVDTFLAG